MFRIVEVEGSVSAWLIGRWFGDFYSVVQQNLITLLDLFRLDEKGELHPRGVEPGTFPIIIACAFSQ